MKGNITGLRSGNSFASNTKSISIDENSSRTSTMLGYEECFQSS